ncbi:MAG: Fic family protein [Myxococcales bacterium]|nr:Fic family protein [Myxococcales bacterium]
MQQSYGVMLVLLALSGLGGLGALGGALESSISGSTLDASPSAIGKATTIHREDVAPALGALGAAAAVGRGMTAWASSLDDAAITLVRQRFAAAARKTKMHDVMVEGSLQASRTTSLGRLPRRLRGKIPNFIRMQKPLRKKYAPRAGLPGDELVRIASKNFEIGVGFVLANARRVPLNAETATHVNRIVTNGLVPRKVWGQIDYRRDPSAFYRWLESPEAQVLETTDPVALAERVHHEISRLDSFPDGNGRTARLLADFVLIRNGHGPAYYPSKAEYFAFGNSRSGASRGEQLSFFRSMVVRADEVIFGQSSVGRIEAH